MNERASEVSALLQRVTKLERQNRLVRFAGLVFAVAVGAALLMAQAPAKPIQREVRAKGFVLVDANGEIRARLFMSAYGPSLVLFHAKESPAAVLSVGSESEVALGLYRAKGDGVAALSLNDPNGAHLYLSDESGFSTNIGVTQLETPATGATHTTSAASIVMFGKDKHVIWQAPTH